VIRRFQKRPMVSVAVCVTALMLVTVGCRGGSLGSSDDEGLAPALVAMSVTAARVEIAPIRNEIQLLGITAASRHLMLRAPAAGRVLGFELQSGDVVRRGEVVARLLNREVEAVESGLAIARRLDPAEASGLTSSVKRYVKGTGIPVIAPEDAIVAQRLVSSGQLVGDLDALADLIDPRSVFVEAAVPVDVLPSIRPGMKATVTSRLRPHVEFAARVAAIAPSFSPGGGSVTARLKFTGPAPVDEVGAPVEARVTTAYVPDAIVIPVAALFQNAADAGWYVFVAGADGRAHRTTVSVGVRQTDRAQITSGLTPGELVITSGGYALSDGLRVMVAQK
jgi:multidrug efflux pump subunit AcrA (membrane-fusion protein)